MSSPANALRANIRDLDSQIDEKQKLLDALREQKDRLLQAVTLIEGSGKRSGRPVGRPKGKSKPKVEGVEGEQRGPGRPRGESLKTHIVSVLKGSGQPMSVKDIAAAVVAGGFQTQNRSLAKTVSVTMRDIPEANKTGRGMYEWVNK